MGTLGCKNSSRDNADAARVVSVRGESYVSFNGTVHHAKPCKIGVGHLRKWDVDNVTLRMLFVIRVAFCS
jgi:hypothetical protein